MWHTSYPNMVAVAQLVEHQFVVLRVAGSSPVGHPNEASFAADPITGVKRFGGISSAPYTASANRASSSTAEQRTLNPQVLGSKPRGRTTKG